MTDGTPAAVVEDRLHQAVRVYEKVKLGIVTVTMLVVLAIGVLLLIGQANQKSSLLILRCAVSQEVQTARIKGDGNPDLRDKLALQAYRACIKRGHPIHD